MEGVVAVFVFWVLVLCALPDIGSGSGHYSHMIYIDPQAEGNPTDCLTANSRLHPCRNITWVFQQDQYHQNSTHYVLSKGDHYLTNSTPPFQNLNSLAITGATGSAVVTCTNSETGLAFMNVADITLSNISFVQCATLCDSTSKNFIDTNITQFQVGLYFYLCESINMSHVNVTHSPNATGVVIYDTNGTNVISHSNFLYNRVLEGSVHPGGGGVYVEFTYCEPGVLSCPVPTAERNKDATYTFTSCTFSHNRADNLDGKDRFTYAFPYKEDHQSFGCGGGLSFYIRGNASGIELTIKDSLFHNNTAVWGGGLLVELHDNVFGSKIEIKDSEISENSCPFTTTNGTAGGGIRLAYFVYGMETIPATATRNEFEISNCTFINNTALNGAGISVFWSLQKALVQQIAFFYIQNSVFQHNTAKLGAAVHVDRFWSIPYGLMPTIWIESCQFHKNSNHYWHKYSEKNSEPFQLGFGAVYVTSSSVWFLGNVSFTNNHGSALAVSGGSVSFDGTYALFANNSAHEGAGIFQAGASAIELGFGTEMTFINNTAAYRGGAMYIVYISRENLRTDANCFMQHADPRISPADWNVSMQFINNRHLQGSSHNAIYATSIAPCSVVGGSGVVTSKTEVLCWKGWNYYETSASEEPVKCETQIETDIGYVDYSGGGEIHDHVQAYPGWNFSLPLIVKDDLNKVIGKQTVFIADVAGNEYQSQSSVYGNTATVLGQENTTYNMSVVTRGLRIWQGEVLVDLQRCPPGFTARNGLCVCAGTYGGDMFCNDKRAELEQGYWMQFLDGGYYITQCPLHYCKKSREKFVILPHNHHELDRELCAPNRNGTVCGECVAGYGPAVNSLTYKCVNCTDINLGVNIAIYLASIYLPLAVLFTVLVLFDIRLTTGPANAFILYCQLMSSTFSLDTGGGIPLDQIVRHPNHYIFAYSFPFGIFNLEFLENFLPPLCLSTKFNTLTVLSLDYCVAFSPLIMIVVVLGIQKLKEKCTFSARRIPRMSNSIVRRTRSINEALVPAFASYLLLSYTKFSTTSAYILATHTLVDENGSYYHSPHGDFVYFAAQWSSHSKEYYPYYIMAIFVCCTFVAVPPLLLLDFPLRVVEWFVLKSHYLKRLYPADKVHILMDTFQGCYRGNMRFFAGVYFLVRLFVNVIFYRFFHTWSKHFMAQQITCSLMVTLVAVFQPYKWSFLNYVDILIFTNLSIINCMSYYLYETLKNHNNTTPYRSVFVTQYILVFLPVLYMIAYIVWSKTTKYHEQITQTILKCLLPRSRYERLRPGTSIARAISISMPGNITAASTESPSPEPSDDEAIIARSKDHNTYQANVPVTVVGMRSDGHTGEASVHQFASSDTGESSKLLDYNGSGSNMTSTFTGTGNT